jgi:hypothetical protein
MPSLRVRRGGRIDSTSCNSGWVDRISCKYKGELWMIEQGSQAHLEELARERVKQRRGTVQPSPRRAGASGSARVQQARSTSIFGRSGIQLTVAAGQGRIQLWMHVYIARPVSNIEGSDWTCVARSWDASPFLCRCSFRIFKIYIYIRPLVQVYINRATKSVNIECLHSIRN